MKPDTASLLRFLESLERDDDADDATWADAIVRAVGAQAPAGHTAYGEPWTDESRGAYVCDLVWARCKPGGPWRDYKGLSLALACAPSPHEASRWFQLCKLADLRADVRILVARVSDREWADPDPLLSDWSAWLAAHRHTQDHEHLGALLACRGESLPCVLRCDGSFSV